MIWRGYNYIAAVGGIGLLALGLRLVYLQEVGDHPFLEVPVAAEKAYAEIAQDTTAVEVPLYLLWLKAFAALEPRFVQALLGAVGCVLLALVGRTLLGAWVGLIAALIAALYGPAIYFTGTLLSPVLAGLLALVALWGLLAADRESAAWRFAGAGVLLGTLLLATPQFAFFVPAALGWLWVGGQPRASLIAALGTGLVLVLFHLGAGLALPPTAELPFYYAWHGGEHLASLDMYHARGESNILAALLWKWGIAFPFGLVVPPALLGLGFALVVRERSVVLAMLLVLAGAIGAAFLGGSAETRMAWVPLLLLFAVDGLRRLISLSWPQNGACVVGMLLVGALTNVATPDMDRTAQASQQRWLGYAYEELGMVATAISAYEKALIVDAENRAAHRALAELYVVAGKGDQALGTYRRLFERWPEDRSARRALGDLYMQAGRPQEALPFYRQLVAGGDQENLLGRLGDAHLMSGQTAAAVAVYRRLLELNPDSSRVRYQLARVNAAEGRLEEAENDFRRLMDDPAWQVQVGVEWAGLLERGDPAAAEKLLDQVLALEPDHRRALLLIGEALFGQARYNEALPHLIRLVELDPRNWSAYAYLSKIYGRLGREEEAQAAYARYLRGKQRQKIEGRVEAERKALGQMMGEGL